MYLPYSHWDENILQIHVVNPKIICEIFPVFKNILYLKRELLHKLFFIRAHPNIRTFIMQLVYSVLPFHIGGTQMVSFKAKFIVLEIGPYCFLLYTAKISLYLYLYIGCAHIFFQWAHVWSLLSLFIKLNFLFTQPRPYI